MTAKTGQSVDEALDAINDLTTEIIQSKTQLANDRVRRNDLIMHARAGGATVRKISRMTELSEQMVRKIIASRNDA